MPNPSREDYDALIQRIEKLLQENPQFDKQQVAILLDVVEAHVWRAGLWARIRWAANVVGALGILAGGVTVIASLIGYDVVRK
jgi:hypothetical protein